MAFRGGVFCQQQARYAVLVCGSSVRCVLPVVTAVRVVLERLPREALVAVDECGVLFLFFFQIVSSEMALALGERLLTGSHRFLLMGVHFYHWFVSFLVLFHEFEQFRHDHFTIWRHVCAAVGVNTFIRWPGNLRMGWLRGDYPGIPNSEVAPNFYGGF